jgi:hypothetical protein
MSCHVLSSIQVLPPPPLPPHQADLAQQQAAIDGNPVENMLAVKLSLKVSVGTAILAVG